MTSALVIPSRFNGPPHTGNGGYSSGVLAELLGDSVEVTLRKPPPLDRPLQVELTGDGESRRARLLDGSSLIAEARVARPDVDVPAPPSLDEARAAEQSYEGFTWHHFPTCFVCGPERAAGDGLRLFTGKVGERELVACAWRPDASTGDGAGLVTQPVLWAALDCPTYFAGRMRGFGRYAVLGRMSTSILKPVRVGEPYVVSAWPIGKDGRRWEGGSAIFGANGELHAFARGLWFELEEP